jgi:hypothetical protein
MQEQFPAAASLAPARETKVILLRLRSSHAEKRRSIFAGPQMAAATTQLPSFPRKRESMLLCLEQSRKHQDQDGFPLSRE